MGETFTRNGLHGIMNYQVNQIIAKTRGDGLKYNYAESF